MTHLTVIRHGETEWNAEGRIQGHQPAPLNERGRKQAEALAVCLSKEHHDVLYSSDLLRTMETAKTIGARLSMEVVEVLGLREWSLGVLEGKTPDASREVYPEVVDVYERREPDGIILEGETLRERYNRSTVCLREIARRHEGARVLVVTHGGVLEDLYRMVNEMPIEAERDYDLYNGGIHRFEVEDNPPSRQRNFGRGAHQRWAMMAWGEIGHLDGIGSLSDW